MNWKKFIIISVSIPLATLLTWGIIRACGDYEYDEYTATFYGNEMPNQPAYYPFNFIDGPLYYYDWSERDKRKGADVDKYNQSLILEEWRSYFKNQFTSKEIESLLYNPSQDIFSTQKLSKNNTPFAHFLLQKKNEPVRRYLDYAKHCEAWAINKSPDWSENRSNKNTFSSKDLNANAKAVLKTEQDPFLRMKYVFQLMRIAFYEQNYKTVLSLQDQYLKNKADHSIAYTRILGLIGGAYYHTQNKSKAGYYYTLMFDNNKAYKQEAMISFTWAVDKSDKNRFSQIYALCKNKHEQAVAMVMKAMRDYEFGLSDIEKAYQLDPKVDGMELLVNREINKLEQRYLLTKLADENQATLPLYNYVGAYYYQYVKNPSLDSLNLVFLPKIKALNGFIAQLIKDNKTGTPALWHITSAYLNVMTGNKVGMQSELKKAQALSMTNAQKSVYKVVELLSDIYQSVKITSDMEQRILPKLKDLALLAKKDDKAGFQFGSIMSQLIAGKYLRQGDTIKGIYAMGHSGFAYWGEKTDTYYSESDFSDLQGEILNQMTPAQLDKVIAFRKKASQSPFNAWLVSNTYYTPDVLTDLKGVYYMRRYDFANAVKVLSTLKGGQEIFPNPFMPHISDDIALQHEDTIRQYTRLSFSKRMAELKGIIAKNPNDAGALYGYAVALYNISYYGKSGNMLTYSRHSTDSYGYYADPRDQQMPRYLLEYYRVRSAEQYFNKAALAAANDPELKAKALWGAAKCWTKRSSGSQDRNYYRRNVVDPYYLNALKNPYFKQLSTALKGTKYNQQAMASCEYYQDYLNKQ